MDYKKYSLVKGYEDYIIFSTGKVYSKRRKKFKKLRITNTGYLITTFWKNSKRKDYLIHRLIAEHFIENPYNLPSVDHIDINPLNNNISNLRWCSYNLQSINQNIRNTNTSGIKGVYFNKKRNYYYVKWCVNYKQYSKSFSVDKYKNAKQLAIDYREKMVEKHYKNVK